MKQKKHVIGGVDCLFWYVSHITIRTVIARHFTCAL